MSKELSILAKCPHETNEDRVSLSSDRLSLFTSQPIGSAYSVQILINDDTNLIVPQSGLQIPAQLTAAGSGPFNIKPGGDTITISTNSLGITVALPKGSRVTTNTIVKLLRSKTSELAFSNVNGHIYIADLTAVGRKSSLKVSGSGADSLGFSIQKGAVGKTLYPSWRVKKDLSTGVRYIAFSEPIKKNPIFKVSYTSTPDSCLRCGGSAVENDWRYDSSGDNILIQNEDLLNQAAVKIVFTLKGSNPFHPFYGTELLNRVGQKAIASVANIINEDVRRALLAMQRLQREQGKIQTVTFKEQLLSIDSIQTIPDPDDPTAFDVDIYLRNASNEPINLTVFFTVPQVQTF